MLAQKHSKTMCGTAYIGHNRSVWCVWLVYFGEAVQTWWKRVCRNEMLYACIKMIEKTLWEIFDECFVFSVEN